MSQRRAKAELSPSAPDLDAKQDGPLAVIAGGGTLPLALAAAASAQGRTVHVIGIRGEAEAKISSFPHTWLKWGEVGKLFATLEDLDCRDLVIIGSVSRPDLANVRFDFGAIKNLPLLLSLGVGGDDQVLSSVVRFLEGKGYRVYGAGEVAPELLAEEGTLGSKVPSPEDRGDIETGFRVVSALGRLDVGQAAVVVKGRVLAVEAAEGTDAMLARCAELRKGARRRGLAGVLVKAPKPGQEERVDLPTIGPDTVEMAAQAGLAGIAVAAGRVLIADRDATIAAAGQHGLFLVGQKLARDQDAALPAERPLKLFLIAGEPSGDALGGKLIEALWAQSRRPLELQGVGGELMEQQGYPSLFPLSEIAVMSLVDMLPRLPNIWRRIRQSVDAVIAQAPDALVILDSPEFTHQVAKRVRNRAPHIPIIDYVSPSVWAWRPGRARKMRRYVDHILAILPFEPEAHRRLDGPACSYVGHPLIEKLDWMRNRDAEALRGRLGIPPDRDVLVVLPGSRASEVKRLMAPFGEALRLLPAEVGPFEVVLPAVTSVRPLIEEGLKTWPVRPHIVNSEADKFAAFRLARAALAASGTVTLELALAGTPMIVAYRADPIASSLRFLLIAHSVVLPNLILGENVFPELLNKDCNGASLSQALLPLMRGGPERDEQLAGVASVLECVRETDEAPSAKAARIVLAYAEQDSALLAPFQRASIGT